MCARQTLPTELCSQSCTEIINRCNMTLWAGALPLWGSGPSEGSCSSRQGQGGLEDGDREVPESCGFPQALIPLWDPAETPSGPQLGPQRLVLLLP